MRSIRRPSRKWLRRLSVGPRGHRQSVADRRRQRRGPNRAISGNPVPEPPSGWVLPKRGGIVCGLGTSGGIRAKHACNSRAAKLVSRRRRSPSAEPVPPVLRGSPAAAASAARPQGCFPRSGPCGGAGHCQFLRLAVAGRLAGARSHRRKCRFLRLAPVESRLRGQTRQFSLHLSLQHRLPALLQQFQPASEGATHRA